MLWDNYWYGGSYGAITYGLVYYWLAQFIPGAVITVLSGGLLPLFFYLYLRDAWGVRDSAAAWALAAVMVVYLAWGQSPFLLAMCLTMGGLVLLARRRPLLAALPCALGLFTNPLALVTGIVFLLGALVARREARRPTVVFGLVMLPFLAARVALAAIFAAPSWEYHYTSELLGLVAVAGLGILLARRNPLPERRALQWVFVALLVVVVPAYLVPDTPVGSNAARFFYVFGAPLLLVVARPSRLRPLAPVAHRRRGVRVSARLSRVDARPRRELHRYQGGFLRPGAEVRGAGVPTRLPLSHRHATDALGVVLLPGRGFPHHPRLVPAG